MDEQAFKRRTKELGLRVIHLVEALPQGRTPDIIGRQLLQGATSVRANYRAACRARSAPDMIARLSIVEGEADETLYWRELLIESGLMPQARVADLMTETNEIVAITVASIRTLRSRVDSDAASRNPKSRMPNPKSDGPVA